MTTLADQIDDAFETALAEVPGEPEIESEPSGDPTRFPALEIYSGDWEPLEAETGLLRWRMLKLVEGFVQGGGGKPPSQARNKLHADAVAAIMADETFGGLVERIDLGALRKSTAVLASQRRLSFSQEFYIQFTTSRTNPAPPG